MPEVKMLLGRMASFLERYLDAMRFFSLNIFLFSRHVEQIRLRVRSLQLRYLKIASLVEQAFTFFFFFVTTLHLTHTFVQNLHLSRKLANFFVQTSHLEHAEALKEECNEHSVQH